MLPARQFRRRAGRGAAVGGVRRGAGTFAVVVAVLAAGACSAESPPPSRWHGGRLYVATGNTTGTYYQLGGGYADLISKYMPGFEARAEPTGASGDNVARIAGGDMQIALCNGDTAADAANGRGAFAKGSQPIRALARLYPNTMQVIVRAGAGITSVADLRGKRVSTGSPNSGTDVMAGRILEAAGLDPDSDIRRLRVSLTETVRAMKSEAMDGMFFTGGLPTPGVSDLLTGSPGDFQLLSIGNLHGPLSARYGEIYGATKIARSVYRTPAEVETIVVPSMLVVRDDMPDDVAYDLTKLLFEHQDELAKVHPEGGNFDRGRAPDTVPVPLHPGARRYYDEVG